MPAWECIVPATILMNEAEQGSKEIMTFDRLSRHVRGKENIDRNGNCASQKKCRDHGPEKIIVHSEDCPYSACQPEGVTGYIWDYPYRPDRKMVNRQFWLDTPKVAVACWDIKHLHAPDKHDQQYTRACCQIPFTSSALFKFFYLRCHSSSSPAQGIRTNVGLLKDTKSQLDCYGTITTRTSPVNFSSSSRRRLINAASKGITCDTTRDVSKVPRRAISMSRGNSCKR